ncbi:hypothetical protein D5086_000563 [Populus alba]|uniref:Uncharacterized protein n=1 Tax=Populus alba TaxID=43335 RepID=A0ACC4CXF8_POPAL
MGLHQPQSKRFFTRSGNIGSHKVQILHDDRVAALTRSSSCPVEIAAIGVAIAIFNQASKVTIFPLVSITTSFVAEEETLQRNHDVEAEKAGDLNKNTKSGKAKESVPDDEMLENLEKGSATNNEKNIEKKDSVPEDGTGIVSFSLIIFHCRMMGLLCMDYCVWVCN